jgi:hypothetical protein
MWDRVGFTHPTGFGRVTFHVPNPLLPSPKGGAHHEIRNLGRDGGFDLDCG